MTQTIVILFFIEPSAKATTKSLQQTSKKLEGIQKIGPSNNYKKSNIDNICRLHKNFILMTSLTY